MILRQLHQVVAKQRLALQRERLLKPLAHEGLCRRHGIGLARHVNQRHPNGPRIHESLQRQAILIPLRREPQAQVVVPPHQQVHRLLEQHRIDPPR